jgi:hypothetical protein
MKETLKKEIIKSFEIELGKNKEEGRTGTVFGNDNAVVTHQRRGEMTLPKDCERLTQTDASGLEKESAHLIETNYR